MIDRKEKWVFQGVKNDVYLLGIDINFSKYSS